METIDEKSNSVSPQNVSQHNCEQPIATYRSAPPSIPQNTLNSEVAILSTAPKPMQLKTNDEGYLYFNPGYGDDFYLTIFLAIFFPPILLCMYYKLYILIFFVQLEQSSVILVLKQNMTSHTLN